MKTIVIKGGKNLKGNIDISGSKNASMPVLISTILMEGDSVLTNIPKVSDVDNTIKLLKYLGCTVENKQNGLHINSEKVNIFDAPEDIVSQFKASFLIIGSLLAKHGRCKVPMPGGCSIGVRAIDIYLESLPQMGVKITEGDNCVIAESIEKKLKGADITLRLPSVGVTHVLLMAGSLANGKTTIRNAAMEPEVVELGNFLIKAGAKIKGLGTKTIEIEGVDELIGQEYNIMADRIEAFSYIISGLITEGDLTLRGAKFFEILELPINILSNMGAKITKINDDTIKVVGSKNEMRGTDIITDFYPGFPTDCQPIIAPLLASINSKSSINETIYEDRFNYAKELVKMGAAIKFEENNVIRINGSLNSLRGTKVSASDLRAGMSLVLAGLVANGETVIENIQHIERGYEDLVDKLKNVGADINTVLL
jgi:UDP-N-acetylglucosamine 1-carboxyvinyltransferase